MEKINEKLRLQKAYTPARKPVNKDPPKRKKGMGVPVTFGKKKR